MRSAVAFVLVLLAACAAPRASDPDPARPARSVVVGDTTVDVHVDSELYPDGDGAILEWVRRAATAVNVYFGRTPVPRFEVFVLAKEGRGISNGLAAPEGRALIRIEVGTKTTREELLADWTLTHEMLHLASPDVGRRWFEEGLATYVEPVARARAGQLAEATLWKEMVETYETGLPGAGDKGLDGTDTWARAYYGGALFFFVADVEIHKTTGGAKGLEHALRQIAAEGGVVGASWPVDRALEAGDRGVGAPLLVPLAKRWRGAPVKVDLRSLFRELGVELRGGEVVLHEDAPLSGVRRAIVSRGP